MPVSRNRKNHDQKVETRRQRLRYQKNQIRRAMENIMKTREEENLKKEQEKSSASTK